MRLHATRDREGSLGKERLGAIERHVIIRSQVVSIRGLYLSCRGDSGRVSQNLLHHAARLVVGDTFFLSIVKIEEFCVVKAEQVQQRRMVIVWTHGVDRGLVAKLVGLSVDHAAFETATGDPRAETLAVVIASRLLCGAGVFC